MVGEKRQRGFQRGKLRMRTSRDVVVASLSSPGDGGVDLGTRTTMTASGGGELLQRAVCVREDDDDITFAENPLVILSATPAVLLWSHLSVTDEKELG